MCGIAVSSSPVVCGILSFWLMVFGKRKSLMVNWGTVHFYSISYMYKGQETSYKDCKDFEIINHYTICDS